MICGRIIRSRTFAIGERRAIGLYAEECVMSFPGLGIGTKLASFQAWGMVLVFSEIVSISVKYLRVIGPRCFRCIIDMLSGPSALLGLLVCIAFRVSVMDISIWVQGRLSIWRCMRRLDCCVLC